MLVFINSRLFYMNSIIKDLKLYDFDSFVVAWPVI